MGEAEEDQRVFAEIILFGDGLASVIDEGERTADGRARDRACRADNLGLHGGPARQLGRIGDQESAETGGDDQRRDGHDHLG